MLLFWGQPLYHFKKRGVYPEKKLARYFLCNHDVLFGTDSL